LAVQSTSRSFSPSPISSQLVQTKSIVAIVFARGTLTQSLLVIFFLSTTLALIIDYDIYCIKALPYPAIA
jgi:hypothetical protein